jgi:hypothetical protein
MSDSDSPKEPFNDSQIEVLTGIGMLFASLSCLGSLFILVCYRKYHRIHHGSMKYVWYLALANLISNAPSFFGPQNDSSSAVCQTQAFLFLLFELASICWTIACAVTMVIIVLKPHSDVLDYTRPWHVFSWGLPLILSIVALATRKFGEDVGAFCWVASPLFQFVFFFLLLWLSWAVFAVCFVVTKRRLHNLSKTELSYSAQKNLLDKGKRAFRRLGWYPVVLIVCWSFPTIVRLYEYANPDNYQLWMRVLVIIFSRSHGFLIAFVYGANKRLLRELSAIPVIGGLFTLLCIGARRDKTVAREQRDDSVSTPDVVLDGEEMQSV